MIELTFGIFIGLLIGIIFPETLDKIKQKFLKLVKHDHCDEKGKK